jgi:hypothetical protein
MADPDNPNIIGEYITKEKSEEQQLLQRINADDRGLGRKANYKGHEETPRKTAAKETNLGVSLSLSVSE